MNSATTTSYQSSQNLDETRVIVKNTIMDYFKRVGIELTDLRFEGIDTTPEYRERLFWLKTGQTAPGDVLRMETVKSAAASLGQGGGGAGALGAGMVLIPQIMNQQGAPTSSPSSSTSHLSQMRRKSASYKQILPQLRNQPNTTNTANHDMPQMRQIHPSQQQVLSRMRK